MVPAPQQPSNKGPSSEPLPLPTRRPFPESTKSESSDLIDSKTISPYTDTTTRPTEEEKYEANALKSLGNAAMEKKDYPKAIDLSTKALAITPRVAGYLSNRAAAHHSSNNYAAADPKYEMAWIRLGRARLSLGDARGSIDAYTKGIEHEGHGGGEAIRKGLEAANKKLKQLEEDDSEDVPEIMQLYGKKSKYSTKPKEPGFFSKLLVSVCPKLELYNKLSKSMKGLPVYKRMPILVRTLTGEIIELFVRRVDSIEIVKRAI